MKHYWKICWSLFVVVALLGPFVKRTLPDVKEDHISAFSRMDWHPGRTYQPLVENALTILAKLAPDQAENVRRYGMPIDMVDQAQMDKPSYLAETMRNTGDIHINRNKTNTAPRIAFALYHELVHVQYGIHDARVYPSIPMALLLGRNEEADAHMRTLRFAWILMGTDPDTAHWGMTGGPLSFLWPLGVATELLTYFWPLGTALLLLFSALVPWVWSWFCQRRTVRRQSGPIPLYA
jgi:hypothetical protein